MIKLVGLIQKSTVCGSTIYSYANADYMSEEVCNLFLDFINSYPFKAVITTKHIDELIAQLSELTETEWSNMLSLIGCIVLVDDKYTLLSAEKIVVDKKDDYELICKYYEFKDRYVKLKAKYLVSWGKNLWTDVLGEDSLRGLLTFLYV